MIFLKRERQKENEKYFIIGTKKALYFRLYTFKLKHVIYFTQGNILSQKNINKT